jgi:hypothetical protein
VIKFQGNVHCPKSVIIVAACANARDQLGLGQTTVTSMNDSVHMRESKHYRDEAVDFRTHDLSHDNVVEWAKTCSTRLGPGYQVIMEIDHLHVEWDPTCDPKNAVILL